MQTFMINSYYDMSVSKAIAWHTAYIGQNCQIFA